jgi:FKBP-type peptidyl-prolyl cis-trans isomerase FkpA
MMKRNSRFLLSGIILLTLIISVSCDPARKKEKEEADLIDQYIRGNNITVSPTSTGLYYIETLTGTGELPTANDSVSVYYTGYFLDGTVFDSNRTTEPIVFAMKTYAVIPGFEEGISYMRKGGKARLLLPSSLAYGSSGTFWGISGYTPLIFDVELVDLEPMK